MFSVFRSSLIWAYTACSDLTVRKFRNITVMKCRDVAFELLEYSKAIIIKWICLRNRSSLAVICWIIIHCLEGSCKGDQITSAKREWCICLQLTDKQWIIAQHFTHLELIYFDSNTQETMKKSSYILHVLQTFRHCTEEISPKAWL